MYNPTPPLVSVVVPVKNRPEATRRMVESILAQTYPQELIELIVVGDRNDPTWGAITRYADRIKLIEADIQADGRDANAKRNIGLSVASGEVLALTDSDMILPPDWIATAVRLISDKTPVVAGGMLSHDDSRGFLARYVDDNPIGAKTTRMDPPYIVTAKNSGKSGYKPPITANLFLRRDVYCIVGGLDANFVTAYEDYPYADRIVQHGFAILCTSELDAYHAHRATSRDMLDEYWKAGIGCADYVRGYWTSRLAKLRVMQLTALSLVAVVWLAGLYGAPLAILLTTIGVTVVFSMITAIKAGRTEAVWYFGITAILSCLFIAGMLFGFVMRTLRKQQPTRLVSAYWLQDVHQTCLLSEGR